MATEIRLLRGQVALVDDEDVPRVSGYRWLLTTKGYVIALIGSKPRRTVWLHRLIASTPDGFDTDHWNRNKLDNRKENLRTATRRQNTGNRVVNKAGKSSKFKGVHRHTDGRWRVRFGYRDAQNKLIHKHVGLFVDEEDAARAYDRVAVSHFGKEFALTNLK